MSTISTVTTPEKGTRVILTAFTDEDGTALGIGDLITPTWTLTNRSGTVVNSRSAVALAALYIVLTGNDLALSDTDDVWRVITIEAQYNSSTYGNGLYLKEQYEFPIENLIKVT